MRRGDNHRVDQTAFQHLARVAEQSDRLARQTADGGMFVGIVIANGGQAGFFNLTCQQITGVDGADIADANNAKTYFFMSGLTQCDGGISGT